MTGSVGSGGRIESPHSDRNITGGSGISVTLMVKYTVTLFGGIIGSV